MIERILSQVQAAEIEFCEEFIVWYFATNCPAVKIANPQMLSCFYESRGSSYDGLSTWTECPNNDLRVALCWPHPNECCREEDQGTDAITGVGAGGASAPLKVLIWRKAGQNPYLGSISGNLHKLPESLNKNGAQHLLISKKWRPIFEHVCESLCKNPSHPQIFVCSYTYGCSDYISYLAWSRFGVGSAELFEIAVYRDV